MPVDPDLRYECTVHCPDCNVDKFKVYNRPQPNGEPGFWMNEQVFEGDRCNTIYCGCGCVLERRVGATEG